MGRWFGRGTRKGGEKPTQLNNTGVENRALLGLNNRKRTKSGVTRRTSLVGVEGEKKREREVNNSDLGKFPGRGSQSGFGNQSTVEP